MQNRQIERDRKRLEEARKPFEEINEQYVGFDPVAGGVDLMMDSGTREKVKKSNMVAFPDSRLYQEKCRSAPEEAGGRGSRGYLFGKKRRSGTKKLRAMEG